MWEFLNLFYPLNSAWINTCVGIFFQTHVPSISWDWDMRASAMGRGRLAQTITPSHPLSKCPGGQKSRGRPAHPSG